MKLWLVVLSIIGFLFLYFYLGRLWTDYTTKVTTLDDASPITVSTNQIKSFLDAHKNESIVIFITPFYHSQTNLTSNKEWVNGLKELQKNHVFEIGLHGYSHRFLGGECVEFILPQTMQLKKAREEFKNAFGYYPKFFRGPCFNLNIIDFLYVKISGIKNYGWFGKGPVFHPEDLK